MAGVFNLGLCLICRGETKIYLGGIKDYLVLQGNSPDFDVHYCVLCRTASSMPPMTNEELARYYPQEYGPYVPKKALAGFLQKLKYRSDLALLKKYRGACGGTLFEVGAGRGEFLREALAEGFEVRGLEPSEAGVRTAQDIYGIRLERGFVDDFNFGATYDCVAARHVLEHLNDPVQVLNKIFKNGLKPSGVLMLKLPRLDSWEARLLGKFWSGYDMPRHRVHFSREAIRKILSQIGFQEIKIYSELIPQDLARDIRSYRVYGKPGLLNFLLKVLSAILLFPFGPGRMIIFARK